MNPLLNPPRMVQSLCMYHFLCPNESLFVRVLSESELMSLYPDIDCGVSVAHIQ